MSSQNQTIQSLRNLNKFYKKNQIAFTVVSQGPPPTSFPFAQTFSATSTYNVTPGRKLYITDLSTTAGPNGIEWDIESPVGSAIYKISLQLSGVFTHQFVSPLVIDIIVKFNLVLAGNGGPLNVGGYEA